MKLNHEQIEAHQANARVKNPHAKRIADIDSDIKRLLDERASLLTNEERELNLLAWISGTEENAAQVEQLTDQELCELSMEKISADYKFGSLEMGIMDEMRRRLGCTFDNIEDEEIEE